MQTRKTTFLAVLMLTAMIIPGAAQPITEKIDFGFRIGPAVSSAHGHESQTRSWTGLLVGGWLGYRENRLFSLRLELLYAGKGYRVDDVNEYDSIGNIIGRGDLGFIFNYIETPLLAKISIPAEGKYIPYLIAGGFAAYGISSKMRLLDGIPFDFDIENANDVDFGMIVGAGVDIKSGRGKLFIETRYDISLSKTVKNQPQKLRTLAFHLGYGW